MTLFPKPISDFKTYEIFPRDNQRYTRITEDKNFDKGSIMTALVWNLFRIYVILPWWNHVWGLLCRITLLIEV